MDLPDVDVLRRERFRRMVRGPGNGAIPVLLGVGVVGGLVLLAAGAGYAGVLLLVLSLGTGVLLAWGAWQRSRQRAEREWMDRWGASRGLASYAMPRTPPKATPLLRENGRRWVANAVRGPIAGDPAGVVCHYTRRVSNGKSSADYPFTIVMLRLPTTAPVLPVLSAYPRDVTGGVLDGVRGALGGSRVIELESVRLDDAFRIAVDDAQSDLTVRRLFTPAFIVWLEELAGRGLRFELEAGTLVVAVPERWFDVERLDWLLGTATGIATRVAAVPLEGS